MQPEILARHLRKEVLESLSRYGYPRARRSTGNMGFRSGLRHYYGWLGLVLYECED
jgi:hypothetical protein